MDSKSESIINETKELPEKPKRVKVQISDPETGKIFQEYTTDVCIVGAVKGTAEDRTKQDAKAPAAIFWIGTPQQMAQLLFIVSGEIGHALNFVIDSEMAKKAPSVPPASNSKN